VSVRDLIAELDAAGELPAGFGPLLRAAPRTMFLPDRVWVDREPIDRAAEPERWLRAVCSDESVVTQFDDGRTVWPDVGELPTCSASMPSVVVGMLAALRVRPGQRVLELGTGTGFNAALLAELVGETGQVVTMEIDEGLAREARQRLDVAGFGNRVRVVVGDAARGVPGDAPYDRIIATMSVHLGRVPSAWVEQTRPGGLILTPVRADLASGPLVVFAADGNGSATGRTLPMGVGFMESRTARTPEVTSGDVGSVGGDERVSALAPWPLLEVPSPRWALAVAVPSCRYDVEPGRRAWLRDPVSGSWATVAPGDDGTYLVRQAGIRRLWDEAEAAYRWWQAHGEPFITDWQWTITPHRQSIELPQARGEGVGSIGGR
jgi:protein-L-isoaspartate O-methyltransferase